MLFQGGVALTYDRAHAHEVTMADTVTNNTLADWLNADVRCDVAELPWKKKDQVWGPTLLVSEFTLVNYKM